MTKTNYDNMGYADLVTAYNKRALYTHVPTREELIRWLNNPLGMPNRSNRSNKPEDINLRLDKIETELKEAWAKIETLVDQSNSQAAADLIGFFHRNEEDEENDR